MQKAADLALAAAVNGTTPIEVKLEVMRHIYGHYLELRRDGAPYEEAIVPGLAAVEVAAKAAPYCHPRLNAIAAQISPAGGSHGDGDGDVRAIAMIMMHVLREAQEDGKTLDLEALLKEDGNGSNGRD